MCSGFRHETHFHSRYIASSFVFSKNILARCRLASRISLVLVRLFLSMGRRMTKSGCTGVQALLQALSYFLLHHTLHTLLLELVRDSHIGIHLRGGTRLHC